MDLPIPELNLLLHLLSYPSYCAEVTQLHLGTKMTTAARDRLCQSLCKRGWVAGKTVVQRFRTSRAGRTLLSLDTTVLPITPDERWVLQSCRGHSITPGQINRRVPANQRQRLIQGLADQGLVRVTQSHLTVIWLTPAGQTFLREDYCPTGDKTAINLTALGHYLTFLRRGYGAVSVPECGDRGTGDSV